MASLLRVDGRDVVDGNRNASHHTRKTRFEFDQIISDAKSIGSLIGYVQHNFAITNILARHDRALIDENRDVGSVAAIAAPCMNGAYEIGFGRKFSHERYV
jgi:hypothetical protein